VGEAKHIRELGVAEVRMMAKLSLESIEVIR